MSLFPHLLQQMRDLSGENYVVISAPDSNTIKVMSAFKGDECFSISQVSEHKIEIEFLAKCGGVSGTRNLLFIIDTSMHVGYTNIELIDASNIIIQFPNDEEVLISNKKLNILANGNTWYGKYGFVNKRMVENYEKIMDFIHLSTNDYLRIIKGDNEKEKFKQHLIKFNIFNHIDANDETMTINVIFKLIQEQFKSGRFLNKEIEKFEFYGALLHNVYKGLLTHLDIKSDFITFNYISNASGINKRKKGTKRKKGKNSKKRVYLK